MILEAETSTVFVPEYRGNRKAPESQQVRVHISRPSIEEREKMKWTEYIMGGSSFDKSALKFNHSPRKVFACIARIENLELRVDGKLSKIETGEQLLAAKGVKGVSPLIQEITAEILDEKLTEDDLKNS